jgi:hypothetical protein
MINFDCAVILGMRIYAMYGFSKKVLIILCSVGLITIALVAVNCLLLLLEKSLIYMQWSTRETSVPAISVIGCEYAVSKDR